MPVFPSVDLTKLDLTKLDLTKLDTERLTALARDAAYVAIGLGVLSFQEAQVKRRELTRSIEQIVRGQVNRTSR